MNAILEQSILQRLHQLDDARLHEVLVFVESLAAQPAHPVKMTGLFSHLHIDDNVLQQVQQDRMQSLEQRMQSI